MIFKIILWMIATAVAAFFIYFWIIPKAIFFYYGVRMWIMSLQYGGELKKDLKEAAKEFFGFAFNWKVLSEQDEEARKDKQLKLLAKLLAYDEGEVNFAVRINVVEEVILEGEFGKNFHLMEVKMTPAEKEDKPFELRDDICYDLEGPIMKVIGKKDYNYILQIITNNPNDCINSKYFEKGTLWFTHPSCNKPPSEQ